MWLPLERPVTPAGNGMLVAEKSHAIHLQIINNGSWERFGKGVRGQLEILELYRQLGESSDHFSPRLEVGDVLIFSKCAVHSSSGDNSDHVSRSVVMRVEIAELKYTDTPGRSDSSPSPR